MASTPSGTVGQNNLVGDQLLYTDTGTYATILSRVLTVYDANGNVVGSPYNMGNGLTQVVTITADAFFTFVCVVTDNTGISTTTKLYVADGFYIAQFLAVLASLGCACDDESVFDNFIKGEIYLSGSQRYAISNSGPASNAAIQTANVYVNNTF